MEVLIDLDENANLITRASLTQDFREVHSKCWIVFSSSEDLVFREGVGFHCWGTQWEAVSWKKIIVSDNAYTYSVFGYPCGICSLVSTKHVSLSALARGNNIQFDSKVSTDLKFEFPLRNLPLGALLYKYRYSSIEENITDPAQSWFLFYDERGLVGQTYASMARSNVQTYDMALSRFMGGSMSFIGDYQHVNYLRDHPPAKHSYKKLISSFIGDKFDIKGRFPAMIGSRYKLSGAEEEVFSKYDKLILIRQKYDSTKLPLPWSLTFGQLLVG